MPKAENFGGLITADHKILSEENESRNNHRYSVAVQDFWQHSGYNHTRAKNKIFPGKTKVLAKVLGADWKPKVIYTDNSLEIGKA